MKKTLWSLLFFFSISSWNMWAQPLGKPKKQDLLAQHYALDTTAVAAYLHHECKTKVLYYDDIPGQEGFKADLSYRIRLKVYTNQGRSYAKGQIPLTVGQQLNIEKLISFKVVTYNLVDGKIQKTVLPQSALNTDKTKKGLHMVHYEPLDVRVGSIIDIQYTIRSSYLFQIPTWYYQQDIPTQHCVYEFIHPEFIDYQIAPMGYQALKYQQNTGINNFSPSTGSLNNQYTELSHHYIAKNIPAFKVEPYLSSPNNYKGHLNVNLVGYQIPGGVARKEAYTWQDVGRRLLADQYLGAKLKEVYFLKADMQNLTAGLSNEKELTQVIFRHFQQKMTWNHILKLYGKTTLKQVYEKATGNAADINLLLTAALQSVGLKAFPVALNTRTAGFVNPLKPSIFSFNYLIAGVEFEDGTVHLLDATDPVSSLDLLPARCLNQQGLRLGSYPSWVSLEPSKKEVVSYNSTLSLTEEGLVEGTLKYVAKDYSAYYLRHKWLQEGSVKNFVRQLDRDHPHLKIGPGKVNNMDKNELPLDMSFSIKLKKSTTIKDDQMLFYPIFIDRIEQNPFQSTSRNYPIEYLHSIKKSFVSTIEIPENYTIVSLPSPEIIKLPNKAGVLSYNAVALGKKIQLVFSYKINSTSFLPNQYNYLKSFYDAIIRKQTEAIILKKVH